MKNKLVMSSGHSLRVRGAKKIIDEVDEARRIVNRVFAILKAGGVGVIKYHDDVSTSQRQNLLNIVNFHNKQQRELDVSVHFNAAAYTKAARGCEVLYVNPTVKSKAAKVSKGIAMAAGFKDRGAKHRTNLAFLRDTDRPALLLEICFVDSEADVKAYRANFEKICQALAAELAACVGEKLKSPAATKPAAAKPASQLFQVYTGTYANEAAAKEALRKIKALKIAYVASVEKVGDKYRVRTGTYPTDTAAKAAVQKIKENKIAWVCDYKAV